MNRWTVEVNGQTLTAKNIIIATGASPFVPPIDGIKEVDVLTSHNLWDLKEQPKKMVVLGGGPIGAEMAQAFARLGTEVTVVEMGPAMLSREDGDVQDYVKEQFEADGIKVMTHTKAVGCFRKDGRQVLKCESNGQTLEIEFDKLLVAVGRKPNISGFGLENLEISLRKNKTIETDPFLRTSVKNIFAVGDVTGPYQFTHTASHQAWYAAVNSLFGPFKKFKVDYSVIPWATFTDPEVARVGLNEKEAAEKGVTVEVTSYGLDDSDRAIADSSDRGWVKVLTPPGKDNILGVTIVGTHAGDLMAEFVLAMKHGLGLKKILGTIHMYPTLAESNKSVAGNWQKNNKPEKVLSWLEKFHRWRR